MSAVIGLDLRYPIGALFTTLGLVLVIYGLATAGDTAHYARSGSININIWWGAAMLVFGAALLLAAKRGERRTRSAGARGVHHELDR